MTPIDLHRLTELDHTTWPGVRDLIVNFTTVPLGGFFEQDIARRMALPEDDAVLYMGILGRSR